MSCSILFHPCLINSWSLRGCHRGFRRRGPQHISHQHDEQLPDWNHQGLCASQCIEGRNSWWQWCAARFQNNAKEQRLSSSKRISGLRAPFMYACPGLCSLVLPNLRGRELVNSEKIHVVAHFYVTSVAAAIHLRSVNLVVDSFVLDGGFLM